MIAWVPHPIRAGNEVADWLDTSARPCHRLDPLILAAYKRIVRETHSWDRSDYIIATGDKPI